jgi:hypothetical protein
MGVSITKATITLFTKSLLIIISTSDILAPFTFRIAISLVLILVLLGHDPIESNTVMKTERIENDITNLDVSYL